MNVEVYRLSGGNSILLVKDRANSGNFNDNNDSIRINSISINELIEQDNRFSVNMVAMM